MSDGSLRPMSTGYGVSFALAAVTLPFLGIGLGGLLLMRAGRDPMGAIDGSGFACFVAAFALTFLMRVIFWPRATPSARSGVRTLVTLVFCASILATVAAIVLAAGQAGAPGWLIGFIALASLCQVATVMWLVRYRREA